MKLQLVEPPQHYESHFCNHSVKAQHITAWLHYQYTGCAEGLCCMCRHGPVTWEVIQCERAKV